jgi:5'(3')-deoxyribonucleotidase
MSTTNENILKSLAVLEQNLKDINSAKEQVNNVVKSSSDLAKVIESYQTTFESLSVNVKAVLDDSRKFNNDSIKKLSEHTTNFSKEIAKLTEFDVSKSLKSIESETIKHFQQNLSKPLEDLDKQTTNFGKEIAKLTEFDVSKSLKSIESETIKHFQQNLSKPLEDLDKQTTNFGKEIAKLTEFDVSKSLKSIESETIKHFQQNLSKPLEDLDKQITNIKNEVSKLTEFDFKDTFTNLEKQVVKQFNTDFKEKLNELDIKTLDIKSKIDEFKNQITRIEQVDLESHFKHLLTAVTNHLDKQDIELTKKYEEAISKSDNILLRLDQQDKESKTLRTFIFLTIGIVIVGIILNLIFKG